MGNIRGQKYPQETPASVPHVGAKVEIIGEFGTYVVVRVDPRRYTADLMLADRRSKVELGVRFESLRVLPTPGATAGSDGKTAREASKGMAAD